MDYDRVFLSLSQQDAILFKQLILHQFINVILVLPAYETKRLLVTRSRNKVATLNIIIPQGQ
jgi:hypothetical protein